MSNHPLFVYLAHGVDWRGEWPGVECPRNTPIGDFAKAIIAATRVLDSAEIPFEQYLDQHTWQVVFIPCCAGIHRCFVSPGHKGDAIFISEVELPWLGQPLGLASA